MRDMTVSSTRERPRRPDESMSLLVDISTQALDPAYADAAARRAGRPPAPPSRRRALVAAAGATGAALIIVVAGVQAHRHAPDAAKTRQALLGEVQQETDTVGALQDRLDRLRQRTERLRDSLLSTSAAGAQLAHRVSQQELAAGTVAVSGPGLRVTVDDAANDASGDNRILDRDLQSLVNALWAAGAEAVAVDDQRLTAQSAIRQAGSAILVNFAPIARPYVVSAVGDPVALETSFASSTAAARMRTFTQLYGLSFHYARADELTLPPAPGLALRFARPVPGSVG
jgi:uncharacterized protein YlxW (UPF0749 family)